MKQEDKNLLLKDLCGRLPYGVKSYVKNWSKLDRKYYEGVYTVESIDPSLNNILACSDKFCVEVIVGYDDYEIKPYLFPLSSMTEEQKRELEDMGWSFDDSVINNIIEYLGKHRQFVTHFDCFALIDWLNKNHFDYRGLIPMGLAIDATNKGIY